MPILKFLLPKPKETNDEPLILKAASDPKKIEPIYLIATAIVIAGVIIAASLIYVFRNLPTNLVITPSPKKTGETIEIGKFNTKKLQLCLDEGKMAQKVEGQYQSGVKIGVNGTPTTILINTKTGKNEIIRGALAYNGLKLQLERFISQQEAEINASPYTQSKVTPAPTIPFNLDPVSESEHIKGNKNAEIKLIEYSDLECPFCKEFYLTLKKIIEEHGSQITWVYRHYPLEQIHPNAKKLAETSECIAEQQGNEAFWEFVDKVSTSKDQP